MKKKLLIGASALILMLAAGCGGNDNDNKENAKDNTKEEQKVEYNIDLKVEPEQPVSGEFSNFTVEVKDGDKPEKVTLYLNMEGMNHPMQGTMEETGEGKYELELPVAMGGKWYAVVRLLDKDDKVIHSKKFEDAFEATGDHAMKYMKGYDADKPNGGLDENEEMNEESMDHGDMEHQDMENDENKEDEGK